MSAQGKVELERPSVLDSSYGMSETKRAAYIGVEIALH